MAGLAALPTGLFALLGGGLGLLVGSFLNVVVHRLPRGESVVRPGSRCPSCGRAIRPWENIPVLSWLLLRGRCAGCKSRISWRYPAVELATGLIFMAIALRYGSVPMTPVWWAFAAALLAAALIDVEHRIIPDEISLGGLAAALALVPVAQSLQGASLTGSLLRSAAGALIGGGVLWLVGFAHARVSVATGRRFEHWPGEGETLPRPSSLDYWIWFPGLGFGDVKLLAMIGAVLGPTGVLTVILVASVVGLLLGLGWALVQRRWDAPFGFGPAIAVAALLVVLVPMRIF